MNDELINVIQTLNPWLGGAPIQTLPSEEFHQRIQLEKLLYEGWDRYCLLLMGPRQAGKTTLGKYIARVLIENKKYEDFLYLNFDFHELRQWVRNALFIEEAIKYFKLKKLILFLDEVQRIENPGLLLKSIVDLKLPIKLIASGSSQLEMKSRVQEFLTGRNIEVMILPMSYEELGEVTNNELLIYGCYPGVVFHAQKEMILNRLYLDYIQKDIIEILRVGKPDVMRKLIELIAHSSGQLVNYNQLANDCRVSIPTIQHYCDILEKTYTISKVLPFVGNKRKEIVANPIYYFIDNGFRNQALRRLNLNDNRADMGLLVESAVFQEIYKLRQQHFLDFDIHFWRTQSGAEVDFVIYKNEDSLIPVEVKYRNFNRSKITRAMRSFIDAYSPKLAIIITKEYHHEITIQKCTVKFISFKNLVNALTQIRESL